MNGRPRDHEFARSRHSTRPPHFGAVGKQRLNIVDNMESNALRGLRVVLFDVGPQRGKVGNRLRRPDRCHRRFGAGFSLALPQEDTQSLTSSCGKPSPRSSDPIACLMPATCHSLRSRYSLIASAARKERLRPVFLANRSNRLFAPALTLTVNVVDGMSRSFGSRLWTL